MFPDDPEDPENYHLEPWFTASEEVKDAESDTLSIGYLGFGRISVGDFSAPCVAEQNASPVAFWINRKSIVTEPYLID